MAPSIFSFNSAVDVSLPLSTVPFVLLLPDPFSVLAVPGALTVYNKSVRGEGKELNSPLFQRGNEEICHG